MSLNKDEMLRNPEKCAEKIAEGEEDASESIATLLGLSEGDNR